MSAAIIPMLPVSLPGTVSSHKPAHSSNVASLGLGRRNLRRVHSSESLLSQNVQAVQLASLPAQPQQIPQPKPLDELQESLNEVPPPIEPALNKDNLVYEIILYKFRLLSDAIDSSDSKRSRLISKLKNQIYNHVTSDDEYSTSAAKVIKLDEFNESFGEMKVVCDKVKYLTKNRLFSDWKKGFLSGTRFSHHLNKSLGNFHTTSKGATFLLAGLASLMVLNQVSVYSNTSTSEADGETTTNGEVTTSSEFSSGTIALGSLLASASFVDAICKGMFSKEP